MEPTKSITQAVRLAATLVLCLSCIPRAHAADAPEATNSTQAILKRPGFREGLTWIGTNEPTTVESDRLWGIVTNLSQPSWREQVEAFLAEYPSSPWAASLHHAYASFCRRTGRTSKALA